MILRALEWLALMAGCTAFALGYMIFFMALIPDLADAVRLAARVVRLLFTAIGWAVLVVRLLL